MSAALFATGVAALLTSDATFQAALTTLLGVSVSRVMPCSMPFEQIPSDLWPCWIVEQGDGQSGSITNTGEDADGLVIGHGRQGFSSELDIALLWMQPDRAVAAAQRAQLPTLIAQLLMRNPAPGGIGLAFLQRWQPDQGIHHPKQLWAATLRGEYLIKRS